MTRVKSLAGRPIEQYNSPNVGGTMSGHKGPVLHIAEGTYRGTISWQMNPDQRYGDGTTVTTSSSWIVGRNTGEWAQMTDSDRIAWCQRGGSRDRSSIELAGYAPDGMTPWQIEACAQILAWEHRTYGVPLAVADDPSEDGLGHHSMDREWLGEEWGHDSCPGSGVIADKAAVVARAKQIINGEDDDVSTQDVITGLYVALARAATPEAVTDAEDAKVARQTRDAIRKILQPVAAQEGTSAAELGAALAGLPVVDVPALAAALAAALPPDTAGTVDVDELAVAVADQLAARLQE